MTKPPDDFDELTTSAEQIALLKELYTAEACPDYTKPNPLEASKPREWKQYGVICAEKGSAAYNDWRSPEARLLVEKAAYDALLFNFNQLKGGHEIFEALSNSTINKLKAENERQDAALVDMSLDYGKLKVEAEKLAQALYMISGAIESNYMEETPCGVQTLERAIDAMANWQRYLEQDKGEG